MQRFDRCGAKGAADFAYSNILGNLEDADEGFWCAVRPHRETVKKYWEGDGMEDYAPVVEVDSTD